jgi:hypothetical protein
MQKVERGELWIVDLGMVQNLRPCLILRGCESGSSAGVQSGRCRS